MNREVLIDLAIDAVNDTEWGYDGTHATLERLKDVDPDYDWEPELMVREAERGLRKYGPDRPPSDIDRMFMALYLPVLEEYLKKSRLFFDSVKKVESGKAFEIPLEVGPNGEV